MTCKHILLCFLNLCSWTVGLAVFTSCPTRETTVISNSFILLKTCCFSLLLTFDYGRSLMHGLLRVSIPLSMSRQIFVATSPEVTLFVICKGASKVPAFCIQYVIQNVCSNVCFINEKGFEVCTNHKISKPSVCQILALNFVLGQTAGTCI